MFLGAKVRRFSQPHNTYSMLFAYHKHGILRKMRTFTDQMRLVGDLGDAMPSRERIQQKLNPKAK
jgi:hypothetical protein